ncbi:MAG: hypothetical protein ABIY70_10270 [Capsulimonas sp.]|uniref:hypothetical protein n=1 Tax=Capsulimonas sp. TaxID=2494211 RepID=UPI003265D874
MSLEYRVEFVLGSRKPIDEVLRDAPHFARYEEQFKYYEYRSDDNQDFSKMPDAYMKVRDWGLYLSDCGDRAVFKDLLYYLFWHVNGLGQKFVIDDLE